jgi:hypothetical protein
VAVGSNATIGLFATGDIPHGVEVGIWADTPGDDVLVATLNAIVPAEVVTGPGTFRAKRGDISNYGLSVGVYSET